MPGVCRSSSIRDLRQGLSAIRIDLLLLQTVRNQAQTTFSARVSGEGRTICWLVHGEEGHVSRVKTNPIPPEASVNDWNYDIIAVGASAGGLGALTELLRPLPVSFPGIVVVQHLHPAHKSHLASLLTSKTSKRVKQAQHGEPILPGLVYIAPPDEHMLVGPGKIQLAHSQLVHFSRPSIDLLLESVAGMYGSRSIGVILSGSNQDGAVGMRAIKEAGGTTIAQDPASCEFKFMPQAAISTGCVDFVVSIGVMADVLKKLCKGTKVRE